MLRGADIQVPVSLAERVRVAAATQQRLRQDLLYLLPVHVRLLMTMPRINIVHFYEEALKCFLCPNANFDDSNQRYLLISRVVEYLPKQRTVPHAAPPTYLFIYLFF